MDQRRLFPILLIIFTNILGAGVIIPILPLFAEGQFGGTVIQITMLSTSFFAAQFLAAPWLGRLSDRFGRRPLLMISQAGTVLAFFIFIYARQLGGIIDQMGLALPMTGGMFMLYLARTLDGITGGNITIAQAYVSDITPPQHRAQGLGLLQAAFGMGFIFGPAFGGFLSNYGVVLPFVGAALITTGTLLLTAFTLKESHSTDERMQMLSNQSNRLSLRTTLSNRALAIVLAIGFLGSLAFSALPSIFALYANHVLFQSVSEQSRVQLYVGLMLTFIGAMQVITQLVFLKRLVTRLGERRMILVGQVSLIVAFFGLALIINPILVTVFLAPFAFGQGISEPGLQSLMTRFGDDGNRGRLLGLYQSARSLALIIGPIWAGIAYQNISPQTVFYVGGSLVLVAFLLAIILNQQKMPPSLQPTYVEKV